MANERQYSSQNPPPYPVTSVAGKTGAVGLLPSDVGLGNVANERQYSSQNPPPYPVTSVAGKTGAVGLLPSDVGLGNVANERQYSAENPPPYPVTSVNGQTGDVDLPITPTWYYEERSVSGSGDNYYNYTVNGDGWILATIYVRSDTTNDYGSAIVGVYQTPVSSGTEYARGWSMARTQSPDGTELGAEAVGAFIANSGDTVSLLAKCTKNGTKRIRFSIMCFGCTLTAQ